METTSKLQVGDKLIRILMLTMMISSMSALMFNIVLPQISKEFNLTISEVSWFSSAYTLIYAIGTVTYGKLADRFRLKNILTFGIFLFALGSLIGLVSQTFWMALVGRCIQSAGAAAIPAIAILIPIRYFAPERRGAALGMTAVGLALGSALGPVIAALIVSIAHWRWLFFVPLLILVTLPYYRKYLNDEPTSTGKFDWIGAGLLAVTAATLLLAVTNSTWLLLLVSAISFILFILRIRTAAEPFVQPRIFQNKQYSVGVLLAVLITGIGISLYFITPILLAQVYHLPPSWIGFAMVPAAIASAFLGRKGGTLADRKGNAYSFTIASSSLILCFFLLSSFTGISPILIAVFLILGNVGQSFMQIAMSNSISSTLPKDQIGVSMGIFSMMNFITQGMATGVYSKLTNVQSDMAWNPLHSDAVSSSYSNLFLVLAAVHIGILLFYMYQSAASRKLAYRVEHNS
ncbi:MFS transporter [Paenibacillus sp. N1-5-1-14]|uniref:MFS transporter n=1 Tax=Paenibacillus radicibacter TaxID=2972488 RepID=UPI002159A982|nr:MFS transporter [Paenibacillus radicibacter]MCR8643769.1 MFS transporter [Paenibacillus radicibacter]